MYISAGNEITCAVVETDLNKSDVQDVSKLSKIVCWGEKGFSMMNIPKVINDSK